MIPPMTNNMKRAFHMTPHDLYDNMFAKICWYVICIYHIYCLYVYIYINMCVYIYIHIWITEHINYSTINHSYTLKPWPIYIHNLPCINGHVPQDLQQIHGLARAILGVVYILSSREMTCPEAVPKQDELTSLAAT